MNPLVNIRCSNHKNRKKIKKKKKEKQILRLKFSDICWLEDWHKRRKAAFSQTAGELECSLAAGWPCSHTQRWGSRGEHGAALPHPQHTNPELST